VVLPRQTISICTDINIYFHWFILWEWISQEQYHIKGEVWDVKSNEKSISSKTYQQKYVYQGFGNVTSY
jgi:hypothetical protein